MKNSLDHNGWDKFSISKITAPTDSERQELRNRGNHLLQFLKEKATSEIVFESVSALLSVFPSQIQHETSQEGVLKLYEMALEGQPQWAFSDACKRFLTGQAGGGRFAPTPAELLKVCQDIATPVCEEVKSIRSILKAQVRPDTVTPERRAEIVKMMMGVAQSLRVDLREDKSKPQREITPESMQAEIYAMADQEQSKLTRTREENAA